MEAAQHSCRFVSIRGSKNQKRRTKNQKTELSLLRLHRLAAFGEEFAAELTGGAVAAAGGAVLATEVDDLEVQLVPAFPGEELFQVALGLLHGLAVGEFPALGE